MHGALIVLPMRRGSAAGDQNPSFADLRTFLLGAAQVAAAFAVEREDVLGRHLIEIGERRGS